MKDGIKALGTYPVSVRLGNSIIAKTSVQVVSQN
jgi:ribosomal protein L9